MAEPTIPEDPTEIVKDLGKLSAEAGAKLSALKVQEAALVAAKDELEANRKALGTLAEEVSNLPSKKDIDDLTTKTNRRTFVIVGAIIVLIIVVTVGMLTYKGVVDRFDECTTPGTKDHPHACYDNGTKRAREQIGTLNLVTISSRVCAERFHTVQAISDCVKTELNNIKPGLADAAGLP